MKELTMSIWKNTTLESLTGEVWVDAVGYDGIYSVSNLGRVRSEERVVRASRGYRTVTQKIRKQRIGRDGSLRIGLSLDNEKITRDMTCLVWESFNGCYERTLAIVQINGIRTDNRLVNLKLGKVKRVTSMQMIGGYSQWISVGEALPTVTKRVLIWHTTSLNASWGMYMGELDKWAIVSNDMGIIRNWLDGATNVKVTHWMNLPPSPLCIE